MRLTGRDAAATLVVAAIVVPYAGYLAQGHMPFIEDPRGMAATGLILGALACTVGGRQGLGLGALYSITMVLGAVSLGLGIAALVTENAVLLAAFIATIVVLWALTTLRHIAATPVATMPRSGSVRA